MIDIKNKIIDTLDTALSGVYVTSSFEISPKDFPCLMVSYRYSGDYTKSFTNQLQPHHGRVLVQLDAVSPNESEAEEIAKNAVDVMHGMKFTCTESFRIKGFRQGIVRIVSRFTAVVQEGKEKDGNIVHQMYRN